METCYLVTGSIKPDFEPLVFTNRKAASKYNSYIKRYSKDNDVWPEYKPVIEQRCTVDMIQAGNNILKQYDRG